MKQELEQELKDKFPDLYSSLDCFECQDGWFKLLKNLSKTIQFHIENLPPEIKKEIFVLQCKEKFGGLRYYLNKSTPFIDGAIAMAEATSFFLRKET